MMAARKAGDGLKLFFTTWKSVHWLSRKRSETRKVWNTVKSAVCQSPGNKKKKTHEEVKFEGTHDGQLNVVCCVKVDTATAEVFTKYAWRRTSKWNLRCHRCLRQFSLSVIACFSSQPQFLLYVTKGKMVSSKRHSYNFLVTFYSWSGHNWSLKSVWKC